MKARTIETGGNRVVRVGSYELDHSDGQDPEPRVFLSAGWLSQPLTPFAAETIDLPADALPALLDALTALNPNGSDER